MKYDYLIVGSGLFGSVFAHEASKREKKCLVIDKREHLGGNIYCKEIEGINVHLYGAHIFHTNSLKIWEYVNQFANFNHFRNMPLAFAKGKLYNLPLNMHTFYQLWGTKTPAEAVKKINEQKIMSSSSKSLMNLEDYALSLVGKDLYECLIKDYTEKQWGRSAKNLPNSIIKRIPIRFTYDNNYFNDVYQGIPIGGYNIIIDNLLKDIETKTKTNFFENRRYFEKIAKKIVFTGRIDEYYDYCFGTLEYRSLKFEHETKNEENFQGNAVINYIDKEFPFTRIIEHKHFEFGNQPQTVITREYPQKWSKNTQAFYPINDLNNQSKYQRYRKKSFTDVNVIFGGRLAEYKYYDMHQVIASALSAIEKEFLI